MYMNTAFDNVCFRGSVVSQSARFVYLCLCKHADNTNQTCFPSLARIAEIVGKSISTIKRAVRELCKYGAIERTPRFRKDGGQTSNLYTITECNFEKLVADKHEIDQDQLNIEDNVQQENFSLSVSENIQSVPACSSERVEKNQSAIEVSEYEKHVECDINNLEENVSDSLLQVNSYNFEKGLQLDNKYSRKLRKFTYVNQFMHRVKNLFNKFQSIKYRNFGQNEPGGGHMRPSKNLSS